MTRLKFNFNVLSITYTTIFFSFKNINWFEKYRYLNFIIECHFNDHALEKNNSGTWFINGEHNNK